MAGRSQPLRCFKKSHLQPSSSPSLSPPDSKQPSGHLCALPGPGRDAPWCVQKPRKNNQKWRSTGCLQGSANPESRATSFRPRVHLPDTLELSPAPYLHSADCNSTCRAVAMLGQDLLASRVPDGRATTGPRPAIAHPGELPSPQGQEATDTDHSPCKRTRSASGAEHTWKSCKHPNGRGGVQQIESVPPPPAKT